LLFLGAVVLEVEGDYGLSHRLALAVNDNPGEQRR